jgi:hypothetical protein
MPIAFVDKISIPCDVHNFKLQNAWQSGANVRNTIFRDFRKFSSIVKLKKRLLLDSTCIIDVCWFLLLVKTEIYIYFYKYLQLLLNLSRNVLRALQHVTKPATVQKSLHITSSFFQKYSPNSSERGLAQ